MLDSLHITLDLAREDSSDKPHDFEWATQRYVRTLEGGERRRGTLRWRSDVQADLEAAARFPPDRVARARLSEALRDFLRQIGWDRDEALLKLLAADNRAQHNPVRRATVTLSFAAAELFALPWEQLAVGGGGQLLANLPGVDVVYRWPGANSAARNAPPESGRVLVAWSAAGDGVPAGAHVGAIKAAFNATGGQFTDDDGSLPVEVLPSASYASLAARLAAAKAAGAPINVLHLLAHGGFVPRTDASAEVVGLALDESIVDGGMLKELLADHAADLRLVVLASCRGGDPGQLDSHLCSVAMEVHRAGVAAVVASRMPLSVEGSGVLAETLYRELLAADPPASLEAALASSREALRHAAVPTDATSIRLYAHNNNNVCERPFVFRPYRGLLSFGPEHHRFFFGRTAERDEVLRKLHDLAQAGLPRMLVVEGASGSGKSSLVMAAVVPRLIDQGWRWARMVPGDDPATALDEALSELGEGRARLLMVDQFEELFTQVSDEGDGPATRNAFVQGLWTLAAAEDAIAVVCTMRTDFRGRCGEVLLASGKRLDGLFKGDADLHNVFVSQMEPDQLRAAIQGPAHAVGLRLAEGLVGRMLDDVDQEPGALPLLEHALDQVWQRRRGTELGFAAYEHLGGAAGALRAQAEAIIAGLSEADRHLARRLLVSLVGRGREGARDTRARRLLSELEPAEPDARAQFTALLDSLVARRLLVRSKGLGDAGKTTVELAHEALIRSWSRLRDWLVEDRDKLAELDKVQAWVAVWREFSGGLLDGDQLGYARQVRERYPGELGAEALDLIEVSEQEAARSAAIDRRREDELEQVKTALEEQALRTVMEAINAQVWFRRSVIIGAWPLLVLGALLVWRLWVYSQGMT